MPVRCDGREDNQILGKKVDVVYILPKVDRPV
jgi:hypothetical protein